MISRTPYHHGSLREALLLAAEAELAERGVEGFTLRNCAKRAGVSHTAPAHHFKDVAGLLSALATEGFKRMLVVLERRAVATNTDPAARLVEMGLGYIEFAKANPALFRLMFGSNRPDYDDAPLVDAAAATFRNLVDAVAAISGSQPLQSAEGRRRVATVWALAHGLSELTILHRMRFLDPEGEQAPEAELAAILSGVVASAIA
jgi:AcrR family transcriptional regulator